PVFTRSITSTSETASSELTMEFAMVSGADGDGVPAKFSRPRSGIPRLSSPRSSSPRSMATLLTSVETPNRPLPPAKPFPSTYSQASPSPPPLSHPARLPSPTTPRSPPSMASSRTLGPSSLDNSPPVSYLTLNPVPSQAHPSNPALTTY